MGIKGAEHQQVSPVRIQCTTDLVSGDYLSADAKNHTMVIYMGIEAGSTQAFDPGRLDVGVDELSDRQTMDWDRQFWVPQSQVSGMSWSAVDDS